MEMPNFTNPEKNIVALGVHEGMQVGDLGAGIGAYTIPLAHRVGDKGRVYAVEVQKEFLSNIKAAVLANNLSNVELLWGDIERVGGTKIKEGTLDAVVASNVLFQVEEKLGFVREIRRILKTGGKLLVVDWKESFKGLGPSRDAVVPQTIALALFEREGFTVHKTFDAGDHHYGLIMFKS